MSRELNAFYRNISEKAERLGPSLELTSLKEGKKYKDYLNDILERADHPIVAFELTKLEEALKIALIKCAMFYSYKNKSTKWDEVKEDFKQIYVDLVFEARRLKDVIIKIHKHPELIPDEWSSLPFTLAKDCNDHVSPISREPLKNMVKLSDGHCYNVTDLILMYNSNTPLVSPFTKAPFEAIEKNLMRTLTLKRRPLGLNGSWGGRSRKSRTRRYRK